MQIVFEIYDPPKKGQPFLAVRIDGAKTKYKKVTAIACKTRADAEAALSDMERDLHNDHWREQALFRNAYSTRRSNDD